MRGLPSLLYAAQMEEARRLRADAIAALVRRLLLRPRPRPDAAPANHNRRPGCKTGGGKGVTA